MTWILRSATCLVWKTLSLTGSVHVWFISLYVLVVMLVTSAKRAVIFPHVLESTYSVTGPLRFSSICKILLIVALCVQQIASMFWITPLPVSNSRLKRLFIYSKRTTILESTITPCKSKTILLILSLSCFTSFLVITFIIISIVLLTIEIQLPTLCTLINWRWKKFPSKHVLQT